MPTETTPAVPMTLEERAREIFERMWDARILGASDEDDAIRILLSALRTVRNEALEEAAVTAKDFCGNVKSLGIHIAEAIRSLKESP